MTWNNNYIYFSFWRGLGWRKTNGNGTKTKTFLKTKKKTNQIAMDTETKTKTKTKTNHKTRREFQTSKSKETSWRSIEKTLSGQMMNTSPVRHHHPVATPWGSQRCPCLLLLHLQLVLQFHLRHLRPQGRLGFLCHRRHLLGQVCLLPNVSYLGQNSNLVNLINGLMTKLGKNLGSILHKN